MFCLLNFGDELRLRNSTIVIEGMLSLQALQGLLFVCLLIFLRLSVKRSKIINKPKENNHANVCSGNKLQDAFFYLQEVKKELIHIKNKEPSTNKLVRKWF